jgi:hypothetical protein
LGDSINNQADPEEVEKAKEMWLGFTELMKCSTIAVIVLLIFMAIFLL